MKKLADSQRDGFEVCQTEFWLPADPRYLDSRAKRDLAICTLFLEREMSIADIICVTDEDYGTVVRALLKRKAIVDRRQRPRQLRNGAERRQPDNDDI